MHKFELPSFYSCNKRGSTFISTVKKLIHVDDVKRSMRIPDHIFQHQKITLVNVYVDLVVFTRIAGTS